MKNLLSRFMKNESGATAIEYGLIAAGIAAVIVVTVNALGERVNESFENVRRNMR
jgi:pilus assembly protein Flp/PilA